MKKTFIKNGFFRKSNNGKPLSQGELSLDVWLRRSLDNLGVANSSACCTAPTEIPISLSEPVADSRCYNLNYYNHDTSAWLTVTCFQVDTISEVTAGEGVIIETVLIKDGGVSSGGFIAPFYPQAAQQALSGAGAVNVTSYLTMFSSTGAGNALTLADGTVIGQLKLIKHYADLGSGVLTPTNLAGGTTVTLTTIGETVLLQWSGVEWVVLALNNESGTTLPVLA